MRTARGRTFRGARDILRSPRWRTLSPLGWRGAERTSRPSCGRHVPTGGRLLATRDQHHLNEVGYAWKRDELGHYVRAKARLVACGFSQQEGIDFFETYSPCPSVPSIRLSTAIACVLGLDLSHLDAERAFVQSELDEDLYIRLPKGCGALSGKVVKLGRSLYGLKQASRTWHHHLVRGVRALGFEQCAADMYVHHAFD